MHVSCGHKLDMNTIRCTQQQGLNEKHLKKPKKEVMHAVREAWRHEELNKWLQLDGKVQLELGNRNIPTSRRTPARKFYEECDPIEQAVLLGRVKSPAAYSESYAASGIKHSPLCLWGCGELGTWKHICWECARRPDGAPSYPADPLVARLGWPIGVDRPLDTCWFSWLAEVATSLHHH